jgi:DNA replication protein DnaC
MDKTVTIKNYCRQLNLSAITNAFDNFIIEAQQQGKSYIDFSLELFETEVGHRRQKDMERRKKAARLPFHYNLDDYDFNFVNGISKTQLNQLRELKWLEQNFNIILMGPPGTGKTYIASGLCFDAVQNGYKAYFRTMEDIVNVLKMKDITSTAMADYKRLIKAHLIIIDDIMLFPITKPDAVAFFNFINHLFDKASFIVTTNKSPKQWAQAINDEVLATALLDRLLYKCEVVKLEGKSYRMENRKTIFNNDN